MQKSVEYLGHKVDVDGLHPTTAKIKAVVDAPTPKNLSELKSCLGLLNYYGHFLPNLSTMIHPLNQLQSKGQKWVWSAACKKAFESSKKALVESSVLVHYDSSKPLQLACDASPFGVGAVLSQVDENGYERPVAFASKSGIPTLAAARMQRWALILSSYQYNIVY